MIERMFYHHKIEPNNTINFMLIHHHARNLFDRHLSLLAICVSRNNKQFGNVPHKRRPIKNGFGQSIMSTFQSESNFVNSGMCDSKIYKMIFSSFFLFHVWCSIIYVVVCQYWSYTAGWSTLTAYARISFGQSVVREPMPNQNRAQNKKTYKYSFVMSRFIVEIGFYIWFVSILFIH